SDRRSALRVPRFVPRVATVVSLITGAQEIFPLPFSHPVVFFRLRCVVLDLTYELRSFLKRWGVALSNEPKLAFLSGLRFSSWGPPFGRHPRQNVSPPVTPPKSWSLFRSLERSANTRVDHRRPRRLGRHPPSSQPRPRAI